jgi:hypothetical protein
MKGKEEEEEGSELKMADSDAAKYETVIASNRFLEGMQQIVLCNILKLVTEFRCGKNGTCSHLAPSFFEHPIVLTKLLLYHGSFRSGMQW